jgi:uncharacterized protein
MSFNPQRLSELAHSLEQENKLLFKKLKRLNVNTVDKLFHEAHDKAFEEINCLECANCCKSISPMITNRDIDRMAKAIGVKPSVFVDRYLKIDGDNDYVFTQAPCPFLLNDNHCMIYADRPKACREYPHTDRKRVQQIASITIKNIAVCPAVFKVVEIVRGELK